MNRKTQRFIARKLKNLLPEDDSTKNGGLDHSLPWPLHAYQRRTEEWIEGRLSVFEVTNYTKY